MLFCSYPKTICANHPVASSRGTMSGYAALIANANKNSLIMMRPSITHILWATARNEWKLLTYNCWPF